MANRKCFSGLTAADTYAKHGPSNDCSISADGDLSSRSVFAFVKTSVTCQKEMMNLACDHGRIQILSATYGRGDGLGEECGDPTMEPAECFATDTLDIVKDLCDGEITCTKNTVMSVFGDPCNSAPKHLVVRYYCG
ncbi:L-rhamnose-binding lectin ELEL-1-like [Saccoglossus kowalevskii]